jgi:GT2 family glycosyltransferase
MAKHEPQLSIVIVSWNVRELLRANLQRLQDLPDAVSREVFVVDNDSADGSVEMVRGEFPRVRLIHNDWNAGFAKANNQAFAHARGEVIIMLNPDMIVEPGALEKVHRELMTDESVGVVGIKLIGHEGRPISNVRRFPDFRSQLLLLLKLDRLWPAAMERYLAKGFDYDRTADVDQVRGAFFAFRRELLRRIGSLDERYFVWFEEVDYCRRVHQAGLKVRYLADAQAKDLVGRSFSQAGLAWKQRRFTDSMVKYFFRWHPAWQASVLMALRPAVLAATHLYVLARRIKEFTER